MRRLMIYRYYPSEPFNNVGSLYRNQAIDEAAAWVIAPWAADIIEVEGGWMAFESAADADTWRKQE